MQLVFQTRFSYVGKLGWRSRTSDNPEIALAADRLAARLALFEHVALASIADQTDDDFRLHVLVAEALPATTRDQLRALCDSYLGADRVTILERSPSRSWNQMRNAVLDQFSESEVIVQSALDDDDGVAVDFVELCKAEATRQSQAEHYAGDASFLNFATGVRLEWKGGVISDVSADHRPLYAPGYALVGPAGTSASALVQNSSFDRVPRCTSIATDRPMYAKSVHGFNDRQSLADAPDAPVERPEDIETFLPMLIGRLPD
ncbi:MAG: glycosyltransferase [Pseudomonadota bacterium]